jgi:hypothetical protein
VKSYLYKDCSFNSDQLTNRPPHAILVFDWLISKKSSPLKPLSHLAEGFQRRRLKCEKLTDDGCQVMAKAHFAFGKVS